MCRKWFWNWVKTGTMLPLLHLLNVSRMLTAYLQCFTHSSSHAYSKRRILSCSKYTCFHSLSTKSLIFRRATCVYPGASLETVIERKGVGLWRHLSLTSFQVRERSTTSCIYFKPDGKRLLLHARKLENLKYCKYAVTIILDKINGTSGPPLPRPLFQWDENGAFSAPSRHHHFFWGEGG